MDPEENNKSKPKLKIIRLVRKPSNIEDLSIIDIARKYPPTTWKELFKYADDELELISEILEGVEKDKGKFFPKKENIFRAFELCRRNDIDVVIFGQDPYHQMLHNGEPRAQGLSFSVHENDAIPSSLQNIFKEIKDDIGVSNFSHGDLSRWSEQGILLLNTCLSVQPNKAGSHQQIWAGFINKVIKDIAQVNPKCIYVLWGAHAKKLAKLIEGSPPILLAAHPSGFSASRGFFKCKHFSQINELLKEQGKPPIDWNVSGGYNVKG